LAYDADLHVVLSMRDDFLIRCHDYPALDSVFDALTPLGPLKHGGLRRALEEPAARRGYRFEDEALVEEIVGAVEGERGSLPLLAFAVAKLWDQRNPDERTLTRQAYQEIGGVEGALAQHAETTLERIPEEHQNVVREIFRNLVTAQGTRAVMDREELLSVFPDRPAAEEVLRLLVNARLLTAYEVEGKEGEEGRHRIEVVHESLLKAWPRLVRWQTQDQEGAQLRDELRQAAHTWDQHGRPPDLLWTGTAYREYSLWRERYSGALTTVEGDFARAMTDLARRRQRIARMSVAIGVLLVLAVATTVTILWLRAVDAVRHSEASRLLAIAQLKLEDDPTEALAYATASLEMGDTEEARVFAVKALAEGPPVMELAHDFGQQRAPAFSPDGTRLAVAGHADEAVVWRDDGTLVARLPGLENSPQGSNEARWAGNDLLVTGLCCGLSERVKLWALPEGREIRSIDLGMPRWWQVGENQLFTDHLITGSDGEQIMRLHKWTLPEGSEQDLGSLEWTRLGTWMGRFTPEGDAYLYVKGDSLYLRKLPMGGAVDRLLSRLGSNVSWFGFSGFRKFWARDAGGLIRAWDFAGSRFKNPVDIPKPETAPAMIDLEASGQWIWRGPRAGEHNDVQVWSRSALPGSRPLTLRRNTSWYIPGLDVHPSGSWLACTTESLTRLTFWPLPANLPSVVDGYQQMARPIAFSPDSRWLASGWADGRLRLWPVPGGTERNIRMLDAPTDVLWRGFTFDPKGRFLFGTGATGDAWVVPLDGTPAKRLEGFSKNALLQAGAVSPSGRLVAAAPLYGEDRKQLRVWNLETGGVQVFELPEPDTPGLDQASARRTGFEAAIGTLLFDGETVLYSAGHGGIRRWNLETGNQSLVKDGPMVQMTQRENSSEVLAIFGDFPPPVMEFRPAWVDLLTGAMRPPRELAGFPDGTAWVSAGEVLVSAGGGDGTLRLAPIEGGAPHILAGHSGSVSYLEVSPDLKWVASTGQDNTLRLWPMPDLSKPPLHTLPHDELIAKLKSLTNLRAVPDTAAENGWKIELDKFPGW